jgi:hypothetical protein
MQTPKQSPAPHRSAARTPHAKGPASLFVGAEHGGFDQTEMAPVQVVWLDSFLQEGWGRYIEGISLECVTIGHLFREDQEVVVIALSRTRAYFGSFMTIPRAAVKSITQLVPAEPPQQTKCVRKTRPRT